jgi:hypothetical protein
MARAPMPAPQMIETPAMRRSAMLAKLLEEQRQPVEIKGGYGELAARLLGQGIAQFSANRAERAVRDEREATREAFLAGLPVAPEAAASGPALAAALVAPVVNNTQDAQQAGIAPVAPIMGSALPDAAPAGMPAAPMPMADVPPMPQMVPAPTMAPAPPPMAPQAPAQPQMPPQLAAYVRQLAQTDLAGAQAVYGNWQQQQAMMSQLPEAIRNDPVAAWAAVNDPASLAESFGMRYRPITTAEGSITAYGPGSGDTRIAAPVIERFDDRFGVIDPLNTRAGVQYTAPRGMTAAESTDLYRVQNPTVPANSRVVNLPTGQTLAEGYIPPEIANVAPGGEALVFNQGQLESRVGSTQARPLSDADQSAIARADLAITQSDQALNRATRLVDQIARGELRLGIIERGGAALESAAGRASPNALAIKDLEQWAKQARDAILAANTGVQTDQDAVRALDNVLASMNDEGLVRQYLNQFITATSATKAALQRDITRRGGDQGQPVNGGSSSENLPPVGPEGARVRSRSNGTIMVSRGGQWVPE